MRYFLILYVVKVLKMAIIPFKLRFCVLDIEINIEINIEIKLFSMIRKGKLLHLRLH